MPYLVKKIEGEFLEYVESSVAIVSRIKSEVGTGDYVDVGTFIGIVQNFDSVIEYSEMPLLENFGINNKREMIDLKIKY